MSYVNCRVLTTSHRLHSPALCHPTGVRLHSLRMKALYVVCCVASIFGWPNIAVAAELAPETAEAYERYVAGIRERFEAEVLARTQPENVSPERLVRLRAGEIIAGPGNGDGILDVPGGLVHHWRGAAFMPDVTLDEVIAIAQDYSSYSDNYEWIVGGGVLNHERDEERARDLFEIFLRLERSASVVKGVLDLWTVVEYQRQSPGFASAVSITDCIRQIENEGRPNERRLPVGTGRGYLWRAITLSTYVQDEGGVIVEFETIGLSRRFPRMLGWIIEPIARRLGRGSAADSLRQLRRAVTGDLQEDARSGADVVSVPLPSFWCSQ